MPKNDVTVYIPTFVRNRSQFGIGQKDFLVSDIRQLQKRLREIDPELRKQLVREAKGVGKKADGIIKPALRSIQPLSGMVNPNNQGRMAWNRQQAKTGKSLRAVRPDTTQVQFRTSTGERARKSGIQTTSLVRVRVLAPLSVIMDMAGRGGGRYFNKGYQNSGYTRPFMRDGKQVRMRLNGQGRGMINQLNSSASRYVWPAIESRKPILEAEVRSIIQRYEVIASRRFA
jgi:hypothetical protein